MAALRPSPDYTLGGPCEEWLDECPQAQPDLYILELQFENCFTYNYSSRSFSLCPLLQSADGDVTPPGVSGDGADWDEQGDAGLTSTRSLRSRPIYKT